MKVVVPVGTRTTRCRNSIPEAQAALKAKSQVLAAKYRTEFLENA